MQTQLVTINPNPGILMFDEKTKVAQLDLPTLRSTKEANDPKGNPLRGIYHYKVIERAAELCRRYNLDFHIEEIFAAQNNNKNLPGVIVLPELEAKYGQGAAPAHILNRVFTTIRIDNGQNDETTTTLAIAYHQEGIQFAIGPCVKVCHNQCIMSPERIIADYGRNKVPTEQLFIVLEGWLSSFNVQRAEDLNGIERLEQTIFTRQDVVDFIGLLTSIRIAHDSRNKDLSKNIDNYPLNQTQINAVGETLLIRMLDVESVTGWDIYNAATELYKPGRCEIPNLFHQNMAMVNTLIQFCEIKAKKVS